MLQLPVLGTFGQGRATASGGTAFVSLIPPYVGPPDSGPTRFTRTNPVNFGGGVTHVTRVGYTTGATAHQIAIMRPFNYTTVNGAVAINTSDITLTDDPGVYSTNYKYANPNNKPAAVANNAIAASDYVAYQLVDGTWVVDLVSSVSGLVLTMTTAVPNISGGGIADGALLYFFGVIGDKDPATGLVNPQTTIAASATRDVSWADPLTGVVSALHQGDPLLFYSPNGTNAGVLDFLNGYYGKW